MNGKTRFGAILGVLMLLSVVLITCGPEDGDGDGGNNAVPDKPPISNVPPSVVGDFHAVTVVAGATPPTFKIIAPIPPDWSGGINSKMGISFFFDDQVDPASLNGDSASDIGDDPIKIWSGGKRITGTYSGVLTPAGFTCMTFTPYEEFPRGTLVVVYLFGGKDGIKNDQGGGLDKLYTIRFGTLNQDPPSPDLNLGFEDGTTGYACAGDCAVLDSPKDGIAATSGTRMLFITSHNSGLISTTPSLAGKTSLVSTGPITIPAGMTQVTFDYKMISAEFKEYIGSQFDDSFIVSITGTADGATPGGSYANIVDSVNLTNEAALFATALTGMPDMGDEYAGETPWLTRSLPLTGLNGPIYITFVVSDVGDNIYSSVIVLDNLRFSP